MSRNIIFSPEEYYHSYCRGTEKRKVFLDKKDYQRFIHLLFMCNSENKIHLSDYGKKSFVEIFEIDRGKTLVDVGAYCLMPNHFHLLLKETGDGNISLFMQKQRAQKIILNYKAFPEYFSDKKEFEEEIFDWISIVKVEP